MISNHGQNYTIKRINTFIEELQSEISKLKEEQINKKYLESEEGFDLLVKSFNSVSKTRNTEKIKTYAQIVTGAIISKKTFKYNQPELYLRIIDELSEPEIQIAYALYNLKENEKFDIFKRKDKEYPKGITNDAELIAFHNTNFSSEDIRPLLIRIEKTGLIKEMIGGSILGYDGGVYEIEPIFKKLIMFIQFHK
ncbi:hypothetical protein [Polaribacter atrinae]|uniref:hypothetical protein n=1 Tax=Polaribacter atrinae TaxID=1333662 RepID=UPI0030F7D92E